MGRDSVPAIRPASKKSKKWRIRALVKPGGVNPDKQ